MTVSDLPWQVKIVHHILILCCQGTRKIELTYLGRWNPKKRPRKAAVFAIKCVNKIHTFQKHGLFIRYGCRIDIFFEYTISNISLFFTHDRYMWHVATKHPDKNVTRCVSTNISEKPSNAGPFGPPSSPPKTWRHWWLKSDVTGWYCWWQPEIRRSPVEVGRGSLSHYLQGFFSYQAVVGDFVHQQYGKLSHDFQGFIHIKVVVWDFWTINSTTCWFFWIPCVFFWVVLEKDSIFLLNEGMAHSFCLEEWSFGFGRAIIWVLNKCGCVMNISQAKP